MDPIFGMTILEKNFVKEIYYKFKQVDNCNMCNAPANSFKILGRRMNRSQGLNPKKFSSLITTIQKCRKCGLIFSNPLPVPIDINDHYNVSPTEYWPDGYFQPDHAGIKAVIEKAVLYAGPGGKVLDVGIGVGFAMKAMLDAGLDVKGIEPSEQFYNYAIEKNKIPKERIVLTQIENAKFEKDSFDYINFGAVLEHLYSPSEALELALQWVKPGGKIEIEVPSSDWLVSKLFNTFYKMTFQPFVSNISPMHSPYHLYEFSLKSFEENGKLNNYNVLRHHYYVGATFLPKLIDKPISYLMDKTKTGMQLIVVLEKK